MPVFVFNRFEPDMLAFSGCYYGGGDKERRDLAKIRRRWKTLHVMLHMLLSNLNERCNNSAHTFEEDHSIFHQDFL